jgi:hypothetical protein
MSFNPFFDVSDLTTARAAGGEFDVYYSENRKEGDL